MCTEKKDEARLQELAVKEAWAEMEMEKAEKKMKELVLIPEPHPKVIFEDWGAEAKEWLQRVDAAKRRLEMTWKMTVKKTRIKKMLMQKPY